MVLHHLPHVFRQKLKKPMGRLIPKDAVNRLSISESLAQLGVSGDRMAVVGDASSEVLLKERFRPKVIVVDGREERRARVPPLGEGRLLIRTANPPGTISDEAMEAIRRSLSGNEDATILVDGEEDLLVLIFLATMADGSAVVYGQPGEGLVITPVNPKIRDLARQILKGMGISRE